MPATPCETQDASALRWNLLDEALIRWRSIEDGSLHHSSLPQLLAAMANLQVYDFPALRPHQRHPWHAFLVQLGAIALHHAGQSEPWQQADAWRAALLALTPDDPDGAAWCLVTPADRPALLQAPIKKGIQDWEENVLTPDRLDMLVTSKNHDIKRMRMKSNAVDDWLYALVSLQTQAGSNSGSYKGISRMNSGAGSRPCVGISRNKKWSQRWRDDILILLKNRSSIATDCYLKLENGLSLLWLLPWDEDHSISFNSLDPFYIEICRRIRLEIRGEYVLARTTTNSMSRIQENDLRKGRTGDPWTPVDKAGAKIMAVPKNGFDYRLIAKLVIYDDIYQPSITQSLEPWHGDDNLTLICQGIAPDGNSKTSGYHERRVPIPSRMRRLLISDHRPIIAHVAKRRIDTISTMKANLIYSLITLLINGDQKKDGNKNKKEKKLAERFTHDFEKKEDSRFFADLQQEIDAEETQREEVYLQWLLALAARAEQVLRHAFIAGPRSNMQRYKAQSAALSRFDAGLRSSKSFPELANHFARQRASRTAHAASDSEGAHHA